MREKLFVGVLTSEEKINSQAIHLNATFGHLVENVKFFITAKNKLKAKYNLSGIVGFTDTRHKYKAFQVVKYVGDSFLSDYDYYFLVSDYSYVNARALKEIASRISVSMNVYLGTPVPESSFCNLGKRAISVSPGNVFFSNGNCRCWNHNQQLSFEGDARKSGVVRSKRSFRRFQREFRPLRLSQHKFRLSGSNSGEQISSF